MANKPAKKLPFVIRSQEEGHGAYTWHKFEVLKSAQDFIKSYWQGAEYSDGPDGFHTDYSSYAVFGFKMSDVVRIYVNQEWGGLDFEWVDLEASAEPEQPMSDEEWEFNKEQGYPTPASMEP